MSSVTSHPNSGYARGRGRGTRWSRSHTDSEGDSLMTEHQPDTDAEESGDEDNEGDDEGVDEDEDAEEDEEERDSAAAVDLKNSTDQSDGEEDESYDLDNVHGLIQIPLTYSLEQQAEINKDLPELVEMFSPEYATKLKNSTSLSLLELQAWLHAQIQHYEQLASDLEKEVTVDETRLQYGMRHHVRLKQLRKALGRQLGKKKIGNEEGAAREFVRSFTDALLKYTNNIALATVLVKQTKNEVSSLFN